MDIIIGYDSALEYWRLTGRAFLRGYEARKGATRRARKAFASPEKPRLSEGNRRPGGCTLPLQAIVGNAEARTSTMRVASHTWTNLPERSVIDVGEGFFMSTPEFCFLQMAASLSLARLIYLGFELCGTYALAEGGPSITREASLTTRTRIRGFVEAAQGAPGRPKALRALRYVLDGSASPMETVLAMMLHLPYNLGGYALESPLLNYRVDVPPSLREIADRGLCRCDLCWPDAKLAVEYDSKRFHSDQVRRKSDASRRSTLIALGFTVVTAYPDHVLDSGAFNRLARQLAKLTGKRLRYEDPGFTRKHLELREQLFEDIRNR